MCTVQCILRTVPVYYAQCTINIVPCTLYHVQCTIEYVLCTMYTVQCTIEYVLCTMYNVQCTLFTVFNLSSTLDCFQSTSNVYNPMIPTIHSVLSALSVSVYLPGPPPTPPNQETRDIA